MEFLLTGFEAYGNTPVNPAESVARYLDGERLGRATVVSRIVPNNFFECIEYVIKAVEEVQPEVVVMMGEYGGRATITVERLAQNLNDGTRYGIADNKGVAPQDEFTAPGGPAAYYTTLPIRVMVKAMRTVGVPSEISDTAGTFCCNHLMYGMLHHVAVNQLPVRVGWIHLPYLPEVAALPENLGAPSMSIETAAKGVKAALAAVLEHDQDIDEVIEGRLQI